MGGNERRSAPERPPPATIAIGKAPVDGAILAVMIGLPVSLSASAYGEVKRR